MSSSVCSTPTRQITKPSEGFQTPESQIIRDSDRMCPPTPKRQCRGLSVIIPPYDADFQMRSLSAPLAADRKNSLSNLAMELDFNM